MAYPNLITTYQQTKYNLTKCSNRKTGKLVKYIVIHYTGTTASAKNNCIYFGGGNRNASADYFIDTDGSIYKFNKDTKIYYSWHCGDGKGKYGITNLNSIGIEVVGAGSEFTKAQKESLKQLVNAIQEDFGVKDNNVVRHYDASRKLCPAAYCGNTTKNSKWKTLWEYIVYQQPVTTTTTESTNTIKVKVTCSALNIRKGAGTNYAITGCIRDKGIYTIIQTKNGWGKLKSGAGWINLSYTKKS